MNSNETHNKAANFIKPTAVYFKSIQDLVQFINERIMNFEHMSLD